MVIVIEASKFSPIVTKQISKSVIPKDFKTSSFVQSPINISSILVASF